MSQTTTNTTAFIHAQQYSNFILENLHDGLLPDGFWRNVTDFGSGTTLNIKTVGTRTIQDLEENRAPDYTQIDTNTITMTITEHVGDAFFVNDELREDGSQIDTLMAMSAKESTRAIQEDFETKFLAQANSGHTATDDNDVNGVPHRWVAGATNNVIDLQDFNKMNMAFNKANVPMGGRIAIVDPVVATTINALFLQTASINFNPNFRGIVNEGFEREHRFVAHIMGWDVWTSNRLPRIASETIASYAISGWGDTSALTSGVANIFMSVLDDGTKPVMGAWRRMPRTEGERNKDLRRDELVTSARYGWGNQRKDTLGVVLTSATAIE